MAASLKLTGDRELELLLLKLPENVQKRVLKSALKFAAKRPIAEYKVKVKASGLRFSTTAIGSTAKTYRNSGNTVVTIGAKKGHFVGKGTKKEPQGQPLEKVLNIMEYGWKDRGQGAASRPPNPMFRKIFASAKQYILGEFQKGIGKRIEKEAARKR